MSTGATLRQRLGDRLWRTAQAEAGPIRLGQRRIYVLPSTAGWAYGGALLVMLVASINYGLSLGYALTFLLGSVALVSLIHAFRNLLHLEIRPGHAEAVFRGDSAQFAIHVHNPRPTPRWALSMKAGGGQPSVFDLGAGETATVLLDRPTTRRGWLALGRITLETRYPLGLVRAWTVLRPQVDCLVLPRPEASPPPLPPASAGDRGGMLRRSGDDDFAGLREHHYADSPRHVAWKVAARGGPLLTKQFAGIQGGELCLDWSGLGAMADDEARLARLAAWALAAHGEGRSYALQLPGSHIACGNGNAHLHAVLRALALHGGGDAR